MQHQMSVPDSIWQWGQEKSGHQNPSSFLREVLHDARLADIQTGTTNLDEPEDILKSATSNQFGLYKEWREVGIDIRFDPALSARLDQFIEQFEDEAEALNWFKNRVAKSPPKNPAGLLIHFVENM
jgi:hypothetical protein